MPSSQNILVYFGTESIFFFKRKPAKASKNNQITLFKLQVILSRTRAETTNKVLKMKTNKVKFVFSKRQKQSTRRKTSECHIAGKQVRVTVKIIGSLSIDDGDSNDNATNKQFDWSSEESKRAARVAHTNEQVRRHPLQNNNVKLQCLPF